MAEIKQIDGQPIIDYMARDYDSLLRAMRELVPYKLPEWTDFGSEADFGNVLLQLFAHMGDILSYYQDRVANESFLGTAQTRRSIIQHLRLIGYRLSTAAPASALLTVHLPETACRQKFEISHDSFVTQRDKHWFTEDAFFALMRLRGIESASPTRFAEGFYCRKGVMR